MSILTRAPVSMKQRLSWNTDTIVARDGTEQRIALRTKPRQDFTLRYLADTDEEIQYWKYELAHQLDNTWTMPLWAEAEKITAGVTAGGTTVDADFSQMDDVFGVNYLLLHPDEETFETFTISGRTATTATRLSGTFSNSYPLGSWIVPIENAIVSNGASYAHEVVDAAQVGIQVSIETHRQLEGKGGPTLTTYNTRNVLDQVRVASGGQDRFSQNLELLDFGGAFQVESQQVVANITTQRSYLSKGNDDRQWWKRFLDAARGQQKSFYTSTGWDDMTVVTQPSVGGSTFVVEDEVNVAAGWEFRASHQHLAIETADGDTQYKQIDTVTTVDNGDGTHTVGLTSGLTATADGSTILKVSFLELVRLGSDVVEIDHFATHRVVTLTLRTIQA